MIATMAPRRAALRPAHVMAWAGLLASLVATTDGALAQGGFQTTAQQAILADYDSGAILFEKDADQPMAPASMAKLMTAELIFRDLSAGKLKPDDTFAISENAWRYGGAQSGGSTMFAALGSRVRVEDLLRGLIIMSGNDAAIALAEGHSGTEQAFATLMTKRARELGLEKSTFRNASGKGDPDQKVTARELEKLAAYIIQTYPQYYGIFGERQFAWNKITQQNRNPLLGMDVGADGLKTGNIDESGFGLVGSAVQGGQRLIVVVNGVRTSKDRSEEARKLLQWGFRSFEGKLLFEAGDRIGEADVYGGASPRVALTAAKPVRVLAPRGSSEKLTAEIVYEGPLRPPVAKGQVVGRLKVRRGTVQALDVPLQAAEDVAEGSLTRRAYDAAWELGRTLLRKLTSRT
jgi:D-alanyl-D-alanine carboxypeptidase (penicillin-binding protein 5/6)